MFNINPIYYVAIAGLSYLYEHTDDVKTGVIVSITTFFVGQSLKWLLPRISSVVRLMPSSTKTQNIVSAHQEKLIVKKPISNISTLPANDLFNYCILEKKNFCTERNQTQYQAKQNEWIIKYEKGQTKTKVMIPTKKECLGEGGSGTVYPSANDPLLVVKKSRGEADLRWEAELGRRLELPYFVKPKYLFIKTYPEIRVQDWRTGITEDKKKYKMVMERVQGKNFYCVEETNDRFSIEIAKKLILQAKECALYLFDNKILWNDLNGGNIFIEHGNSLRIIDYGSYKYFKGTDDYINFFLRSERLINWIVRCCVDVDKEDIKNISQPISFMGVLSGRDCFQSKIENKSPDEIKNIINNYFDCVVSSVDKIRKKQ